MDSKIVAVLHEQIASAATSLDDETPTADRRPPTADRRPPTK
tara:strand:+ start:1644 stop:1769 length:126 start_codon:yes stop_codon:yes gene_type:complete